MHIHLGLVTHIGEQVKMFVKNTLGNANSALTCFTKHLSVGTLARRRRSALGAAVMHASNVSGVALDGCIRDSNRGFTLHNF